MAESPPIIFIARYVRFSQYMNEDRFSIFTRHGARLDAADKDWHLTSPTPYDPPLSYGGWLQSRALGIRIGSLLEAPEFTGGQPRHDIDLSINAEPPANLEPTQAPSESCNRYNIIIHTSPYLRCIQTATAVTAGLSQACPRNENTVEDLAPTRQSVAHSSINLDTLPLLRVDAFLGEWLSPDYFDQIIPPPASDRMVAAAKAELLRREEIILSPAAREGSRSLSGHFPGGWGSFTSPTSPKNEMEYAAAQWSQSSPTRSYHRQRASTVDVPQSSLPVTHSPQALSRLDTNLKPAATTSYVPPTPNYAVSASDPIPVGYVAHARDACLKIDYQWDSMRTPTWGTGGEYGEEWSTMQERVTDGFNHMLEWYQDPNNSHSPSKVSTSTATNSNNRPPQTVLIIITHGADCNALINSLAGRPHLLDIGTASLTLAVPRYHLPRSEADAERLNDSSSRQSDSLISRKYDMPLMVSIDHLRAGIDPSQLTSLTSPSGSKPPLQPSVPTYRNRLGSRPAAVPGSISLGPAPALGWSFMHRPSTSGSPSSASGLWGPISSPTEKEDEADDFVPNFRDKRPASQDSPLPETAVETSGWQKKLPQRTNSQRGLWGSAPPLEDRETGSRRRWTLAEQKL